MRNPLRGTGAGRRTIDVLSFALVPLAILLAWQTVVVTGVVREGLLPTPGEVAATWWDLVTGTTGEAGRYSAELGEHAGASLVRVTAGFAVAVVLGVGLGLAIGLSPAMERILDPTIQVLRNIPITALVPVAILFFGISDRPAVFLIALGAVFPTVVNTTYGVKQVDRLFVRSGEMMGASRWQLVTRIVLPAASPAIFTGVRLSMGVAWVLVVVSELIAVRSGLGYLLYDAYQFFSPDVMLAAMLTIGLLGFLSDRLILFVRDRALAWNRLQTIRG